MLTIGLATPAVP